MENLRNLSSQMTGRGDVPLKRRDKENWAYTRATGSVVSGHIGREKKNTKQGLTFLT